MADLIVSCLVSRTELALSALELEAIGSYRVVSAGPGALTWRKQFATSPFEHGGSLVYAAKDMGVAPLIIRVYGTSDANLDVRTAALLRAFEQFNYQTSLTINGVVHTWDCFPADYAPVEGLYDPHYLRSLQQVYSFQVPRDPTPVAGSM